MGDWIYIPGQGGGGFQSKKVGDHGFGGPFAMSFVGNRNSDVENNRLKPGAPREQLYNLRNDPRQQENVIRRFPKKHAEMKARLAEFMKSATTTKN